MRPDLEGTEPGLSKKEPKKILNLKCRRGDCTSIEAVDMTMEGVPGRRYQCTKCHHMWVIDVGGPVNF